MEAAYADIGPARARNNTMNSRVANMSFFVILATKLIFLYSAFVHMLHKQRSIELLLIQTLFACALFMRIPYSLELKNKKQSVFIVTLLVLTLVSLLMYAFPFIDL
jgi:hypothetical protein